MTRGRTANIAHLVAADPADARAQWIAAFGRDRADLGPTHAAQQAAAAAARYAGPRPLEEVLTALHRAWSVEQRCVDQLAFWQPQRDLLRQVVTLEAAHVGELPRLDAGSRQAALAAQRAIQRAEASGAVLAEEADRIREYLLAAWDGERGAARAAARVVLDGPRWWGLKLAAVALASEQLADWADRWRAHLPDLPTDPHQIAQLADRFDDRPALWTAFDTTAHRAAEREHPDHAQLHAAAQAARRAAEQARRALADAHRRHDERLAPLGPIAGIPDPERRLADLERDVAATQHELAAAQVRVAELAAEPALLTRPAGWLDDERERWRARHNTERTARRAAGSPASSPRPAHSVRPPEPVICLAPRGAGPGIGR